MNFRLFTLLSAALVAAAMAAPAADAASTTVVISQVSFRGPTGGNDELIELRNISQVDQSDRRLADLRLQQHAGSSVLSRRRSRRDGRCRSARCTCSRTQRRDRRLGRLVLRTVPGDQIFTTGVGDTGGIQLRNAAGTVIDPVGATGRHPGLPRGRGSPLPDRERRHGVPPQRRTRTPTTTRRISPAARATPENCGTACTVTAPARAVRPRSRRDDADHEHPDARGQRRVQRHAGHDPRHRHGHRRPLRLELREHLQGRRRDLDPERDPRPAGHDLERAVRRRHPPRAG